MHSKRGSSPKEVPLNPKHPRLVAPFLLVSLSAVLAGTSAGVIALLRSLLALGVLPPALGQIHGRLQIFGFLLPFVLGCSTFVFPRIAAGRPLRHPELALAAAAGFGLSLLLQLAGWALPRLVIPLWRASGLALALAGLFAAAALEGPLAELRRLRRGQAADRGYEPVLEIALLFVALAAATEGLALWRAAAASDLVAPFTLAAAAERLALGGGAAGIAFGVSTRMFPGFLGIDPGRARPPRWTVLLWATSVALGAAGSLAGIPRIESGADLLFALAALSFAARLGLATRRGGPAIDRSRDPLFPWGARVAYASLAASAMLGGLAALGSLAGLAVHAFWTDAARHLLVLGFLSTLVATMAGRLAPGWAGRPLALPWARGVAVFALPLAAALRATEGIAGQWGPAWVVDLAAASGPVGAIGFLGLVASVGTTLARPPRASGRTQGPSVRRAEPPAEAEQHQGREEPGEARDLERRRREARGGHGAEPRGDRSVQ